MTKPFLTAEWRNLFLATYAVPPSLLKPRLPPGLELDTRGGDTFVSLVAFEFLRTAPQFPLVRRIVPVVALGNFPELNLRFYVRQGRERGVVFVREFVPRRLVAWLARLLYNEPYRAAPLTSTWRDDADSLAMEYRLTWAGREHRVRVTGAKPPLVPGEASDEHFFKEHRWGFGTTRRGRTLRYEVRHPVWEVFPVRSYAIDLDWAAVYGPEWGFLGKATPCSTVLAAGSPVAVYPKGEPTAA
jgi:uncharacterized protein YqjF (DUF2071 family)